MIFFPPCLTACLVESHRHQLGPIWKLHREIQTCPLLGMTRSESQCGDSDTAPSLRACPPSFLPREELPGDVWAPVSGLHLGGSTWKRSVGL